MEQTYDTKNALNHLPHPGRVLFGAWLAFAHLVLERGFAEPDISVLLHRDILCLCDPRDFPLETY